MLIRFGAQVGKINIAIFQTRNRYNFETGHDRAGRIRPVRGGWDETDIAMRLAARCMILADVEQSGVFASGFGVGLQ